MPALDRGKGEGERKDTTLGLGRGKGWQWLLGVAVLTLALFLTPTPVCAPHAGGGEGPAHPGEGEAVHGAEEHPVAAAGAGGGGAAVHLPGAPGAPPASIRQLLHRLLRPLPLPPAAAVSSHICCVHSHTRCCICCCFACQQGVPALCSGCLQPACPAQPFTPLLPPLLPPPASMALCCGRHHDTIKNHGCR